MVAGKYRIERVLGAGGMGVVTEATHLTVGRPVALKLLSLSETPLQRLAPELASASVSASREAVARFQREARAAGAIETEHVVQVLDAGADDETGIPYVAMERLRGEPLDVVLARTAPLAPAAALRITAQACRGLVRAHQAGVIHRDIKPGNLFVSEREDGERIVKILDFGIAKMVADAHDDDLTATGGILGSPRYMAPEQIKGLKGLDGRVDLWSLGVVLYEALSGIPPHAADTTGQLLLAICTEPARPLQDVAPWVQPDVATCVHRALSLDPTTRWPDAEAMLTALTELVDDLRLVAATIAPVSAKARAIAAPTMAALAQDDATTILPAHRGKPIAAEPYAEASASLPSPSSLEVTPPPPSRRWWVGLPLVAGAIGALLWSVSSPETSPPDPEPASHVTSSGPVAASSPPPTPTTTSTPKTSPATSPSPTGHPSAATRLEPPKRSTPPRPVTAKPSPDPEELELSDTLD